MDWTRHFKLVASASLCIALLAGHTTTALALTLKQAEHAAVTQSPEMHALQATSQALQQSAIAAGQLSDPKLVFATKNIPVDSFDFSQEPMTQIQVGLQQDFPRGRSLHYRALQKKSLSAAKTQKLQVMRLHVQQGVRLSWLQLYYWLHARRIITHQREVFHHLVDVTAAMLANNKAQQKDVIRAQLELSNLDNRLLNITQQVTTARAQLARWIGPRLAKQTNPSNLPTWHTPPHLLHLYTMLKHHPLLQADTALISAGHAGVNLAKQQYIPGFRVGVAYGFRQGRDIDDSKRADFLSAHLSVDLPVFTRNRQNRTLKASEDTLVASEQNQMSVYRQLRQALKTQYTAWRQQRKSAQLYKTRLLPEAKQYAESTLIAYQNAQTDFPTLARAYVRELTIQLDALQAIVGRQSARVNLLYLQGK